MRKIQSIIKWSGFIGVENHPVSQSEYDKFFIKSKVSYSKLQEGLKEKNVIPLSYLYKPYQSDIQATLNGLLPSDANVSSLPIDGLKYPCVFKCFINGKDTPFASIEFNARSDITRDIIEKNLNHGIACMVSSLVEEKNNIRIGNGYMLNVCDDATIPDAFNYKIVNPNTSELVLSDTFKATDFFHLPNYSFDDVVSVLKNFAEELPPIAPAKLNSLDDFISAAQKNKPIPSSNKKNQNFFR